MGSKKNRLQGITRFYAKDNIFTPLLRGTRSIKETLNK